MFSSGIPFYFEIKHIILDGSQNFPFVQLEIPVFLIEFFFFYLIDLSNCTEDASSILLILPLFVKIFIVLLLAMFVQLEEIGLLIEPLSLLGSFLFVCLSYDVFVLILELAHLKASLSSFSISFFFLELRRNTYQIVSTVLLFFHRL